MSSDSDGCTCTKVIPDDFPEVRSRGKGAARDRACPIHGDAAISYALRRRANASAWDEGFAAAEISKPSSRKGHWEPTGHGVRTWVPDPLPTNPYRVPLSGSETTQGTGEKA